MIDISKGRYWDKGVELVSGCTPCSTGCDNCWSAAMTHRFQKGKVARTPYLTNGERKFNGQIITHPDRLDVFRKTRKPTVFAIWNDFYHGAVDQRFRLDAARIMDCCDRHTFLILTKRADQAANYGKYIHGKNIWNGLTVCNQQEADEKIPIFLQVPGNKFLSIEPCLSEIGGNDSICDSGTLSHKSISSGVYCQKENMEASSISCVILGGETGPKARPLHPDWVRSIRDQCAAAGVPFFFKGWGRYGLNLLYDDDEKLIPKPERTDKAIKNTGRLIDGKEHNELPWVKV